ncbi:uncharacterized protein Pyn_15893 [Prunus yedoensis var. nudiflora]|uniref:Agenet-like domain-containing protein n=1 Tax=Prunus yedoensis var. nudiflora TaxID=2094558 RepID=A0A314ZPY9_PRUYE|nr:uncharacterized protein Pyn_15893 [Prunus yedoensis var. nudiflora]
MPSGSWCCAKIICGNGHNYTVRYDGFEGASGKAAVERVPRNAIRPCPPPLEVSIIGFLVISSRLLGSSQEFKVGKFEIRVRQFWQDDKWVVIGKGLSNYEYGKRVETFTLKYNQSSCLKAQKNEMHIDSSHNLKRRSPFLYSQDEAYDGSAESLELLKERANVSE